MVVPLSPRKSAAAKFNGDFYEVVTLSGYGRLTADPLGLRRQLEPNASDLQLGEAVRECLAKSRFLDTPEKRGDLFHRDRMTAAAAAWETSIMERYKYKSKAAIYRMMRWVDVDEVNNQIEVTPSFNDRGKVFTAEGIAPEMRIQLPSDASATAVGAALREAFRRCRGPGAEVPGST